MLKVVLIFIRLDLHKPKQEFSLCQKENIGKTTQIKEAKVAKRTILLNEKQIFTSIAITSGITGFQCG